MSEPETIGHAPDLNVDAIRLPPSVPADTPDSQSNAELRDAALAERKAQIQSLLQDIAERRNYASKIYWLVCGWVSGAGALLLLEGFLGPWGLFQLPDAVMLAAIGGTTVNVIGLFIIVANYLFPKRR